MNRGRIARAACVLLGGAAVTLVVSWGAALALDGRFTGPSVAGYIRRDHVYATTLEVQGTWATGFISRMSAFSGPAPTNQPPEAAVPAWSRLEQWALHPPPPGVDLVSRYEFAFGWPCRAMSATLAENPGSAPITIEGFRITDVSPQSPRFPTVLPARVLWLGFILNSAAASALVWIAWWAMTGMTGFGIGRRGHCPTCGYDLRDAAGHPCPECGSTAKAGPPIMRSDSQ